MTGRQLAACKDAIIDAMVWALPEGEDDFGKGMNALHELLGEITADDPRLALASGPLTADLCECDALCECDRDE
jgi:hypothetical protein